MHADEVLCLEEKGGATWDTLGRGYMMRKVVNKEGTTGARFDFFLDSETVQGLMFDLGYF